MRRKNTTSEMMKDYIADSLLILLRNKAYDSITISEITMKAGVNRSTYYRNFETKEDIIKYYFTKIINEYLDTLDEKEVISIRVYLTEIFAAFQNYRQPLLLIYHRGVSYHFLDALNKTFTLETDSHTFQELLSVSYHTGGIFNSFQLWFSDEMRKSPAEMAQDVMSILPQNFTPMLIRKKT